MGRTAALLLISGLLLNCCGQLAMINNNLREISVNVGRR